MKEKQKKKRKITKKAFITLLLAVLLPVTALVGTAIAATFDVQTNLTVVKNPRGNNKSFRADGGVQDVRWTSASRP